MKTLITGNMGYVGPSVVKRLRHQYPDATLVGLDAGFFAHSLTNAATLPESLVDVQFFADVRCPPPEVFDSVDAVVHLAAISNNPMGKTFEQVTYEINFRASVEVAKQSKARGVESFVFASSCSMYGLSDGTPRTETSSLNPRTKHYTRADSPPGPVMWLELASPKPMGDSSSRTRNRRSLPGRRNHRPSVRFQRPI